jgi:hypothetical protein
LVIGVEKAPCQIYQGEAAIGAHQTVEDLDRTLEESAESVASHMQVPKVMAKFEILEIGNVGDHYLHFLNRIAPHETVDVREQMMVRRERDLETADHPLPPGVKADRNKVRKMEVRDHQGGNFRNVRLSSGHQLLPSRIVNGAQRCDLTNQRLSHRFHLVRVARPLRLPPSDRLRQSVAQS